MFRVIKLECVIDFNIQTDMVVGMEYINKDNITLLYCFCKNTRQIEQFYESLKKDRQVYLLPQFYHDVYKKNYYYDRVSIISTTQTEVRLFEHVQYIHQSFFIFFEAKINRKRINEKIEFSSIEELKSILISQYEVKYLIPFFYSNREMKEFMNEKRIKIKDINLLYLIENKTLEGKKR